ncbi:DUF1924 domain-containing protein [Aromatoleum toluclasticum]|uniref:DUF1924 domain-containing protein n=1 Tax=Aromatoleum toluclasticum TaxID=92003 RepID=UPI001D185154|nr:DUF1924 domain-containing protein [Aromatoleum toluclasticum]MCC4118355.1 DUF1924 domain-containing protein [Aromatoleum toluclasticum]
MRNHSLQMLFGAAALIASGFASAETPADFLARYETEARQSSPSFNASAERGEKFFTNTHGGEWSCSTCHTKNPTARGKHANTGKAIEPMAPGANPERFANTRSVEKWFGRNCKDVLGRTCTPGEKADVVAWLMISPR